MTEITQAKRQAAFRVWKNAFDKYRIDVTCAGRPFQSRWIETPSEFSDDLTFAADILWGISNSLTEKSVPIFAEKVKNLVKARREHDYLMCLSELEFPGLLASLVSPIAFEPAVPLEANPAAKPPSSDYSICLPSGEVFIEATTIDLRDGCIDSEAIMKRLDRKLDEKRRQAIRDRIYLLALKILGMPQTLTLAGQLVKERVWPNPKNRRYGGLICYVQAHNAIGSLEGMWLQNHSSLAPPSTDVADLMCGRRCFHLHRVKNLECAADEILLLRQRVALPSTMFGDVFVPARLVGGPLDGISISLKPTQVGDSQIIFAWELQGCARMEANRIEIPPHGPIQIVYKRQADTWYQFVEFRLWINEWRPSVPRSDYLPKLRMWA